METVLEVKNLVKSYGDLIAVNDISFSIKKGEIFGLLGPNGAGKTSTVEMIEYNEPRNQLRSCSKAYQGKYP